MLMFGVCLLVHNAKHTQEYWSIFVASRTKRPVSLVSVVAMTVSAFF